MPFEEAGCPACRQPVQVPTDGHWLRCPHCRRGRLRWVPEAPTDAVAERLRADLAELRVWVAEGLRGAAELAASVQARLDGELRRGG